MELRTLLEGAGGTSTLARSRRLDLWFEAKALLLDRAIALSLYLSVHAALTSPPQMSRPSPSRS